LDLSFGSPNRAQSPTRGGVGGGLAFIHLAAMSIPWIRTSKPSSWCSAPGARGALPWLILVLANKEPKSRYVSLYIRAMLPVELDAAITMGTAAISSCASLM
jgi:hypothetical protein